MLHRSGISGEGVTVALNEGRLVGISHHVGDRNDLHCLHGGNGVGEGIVFAIHCCFGQVDVVGGDVEVGLGVALVELDPEGVGAAVFDRRGCENGFILRIEHGVAFAVVKGDLAGEFAPACDRNLKIFGDLVDGVGVARLFQAARAARSHIDSRFVVALGRCDSEAVAAAVLENGGRVSCGGEAFALLLHCDGVILFRNRDAHILGLAHVF